MEVDDDDSSARVERRLQTAGDLPRLEGAPDDAFCLDKDKAIVGLHEDVGLDRPSRGLTRRPSWCEAAGQDFD